MSIISHAVVVVEAHPTDREVVYNWGGGGAGAVVEVARTLKSIHGERAKREKIQHIHV